MIITIKFNVVTSKLLHLPGSASQPHKELILNSEHIIGALVDVEGNARITCIGNIAYDIPADASKQFFEQWCGVSNVATPKLPQKRKGKK